MSEAGNGGEDGPDTSRETAARAAERRDRSPTDPNGSGGGTGAERTGPDPDSIGRWTSLALALAAVSALTGVATYAVHDAAVAAAGAVVLAAGFGAIVAVSRASSIDLVAALAAAWAEHRRYVGFAAGLFGLGAIVGALLVAVGVDLTELFLDLLSEEFSEEELAGEIDLSASFFITNNTPPFLAVILGALTFGLVTALIMLFNGVIIGNLLFALGSEAGLGLIVVLIVPHGIFELPALFIAAGVGFRLLHRAAQRFTGSRDDLFTKSYLGRTAVLVAFGWLLLVLAAFIEAYLTIAIAELLFPDQAL
ncbi:stage II sporulation protein M [Halosolutus gelatinilyticus]|uniref:stage II sporulation protein M n=1 Tax=Halosolutus gelatinilyticus TaxID=2931975 RepID=UPI001FF59A9C|nr:stage II sporulation protein M [Halosolutus gelatinilyticus]